MEIFSARRLTNMGLIAAIYVVATMLCSSLAYGQVQFRISEVLMLLCYFNKDYIISLSIGCLIVNLFSTLGMVDVVFGTLATVVAAVLIYLLRNKVNLVLVNMGWVALGEFVCVTIVGVILIKALMKNKYFSKLVTFGMSDQALSEQFKNG